MLNKLEEILGYKFNNTELLQKALTHTSKANEMKLSHLESNERLEFLGDAVLEEVISIYLYEKLPAKPEGDLTKLRAAIVCEESLAEVSVKLGINEFLLLGNGEDKTGGRNRPSVVSDSLEAIFGAVYLDGGQEAAKAVILRLLQERADMIASGKIILDPKSELQEYYQSLGKNGLKYEIVSTDGPAHALIFTAAVLLDGEVIGRGKGSSKQNAQMEAARAALQKIQR